MSKTLSETEPLNLFNLLHNTTTFNLLHNTTHRNLLQNTTTPNRTNNQPILSADSFWTLPIFIIFIISGVFGNCLVCLAISTNRSVQIINYTLGSFRLPANETHLMRFRDLPKQIFIISMNDEEKSTSNQCYFLSLTTRSAFRVSLANPSQPP